MKKKCKICGEKKYVQNGICSECHLRIATSGKQEIIEIGCPRCLKEKGILVNRWALMLDSSFVCTVCEKHAVTSGTFQVFQLVIDKESNGTFLRLYVSPDIIELDVVR